jgi:hypothetical protein
MLLALQSFATPACARIGSCGGCGTVTDVDAIHFARDKAPEGAPAGTIVGGTPGTKPGKPATAANVSTGGLVGRKAGRNDQGDDARGLRLEIKMDGGGRRTIEVVEGQRIYKGDRVRVFGTRIEMLD